MRLRQILLPGALVATVAAAIQPYRLVLVVGPSMSPTFHEGSILVATPHIGTIRRGDVVVIDQGGTRYVKRVAFVGGDSFPEFRVVGQWVPPVSDKALSCGLRNHFTMREVIVPRASVYVVGDNVAESIDSRSFGPVPVRNVVFKVLGPSCTARGPYYAGAHLADSTYMAARY